MIGNQNEGAIISKATTSTAFVWRRKTQEIENVKLSRVEDLKRHNELSALNSGIISVAGGYEELLSPTDQCNTRPQTMQHNTRFRHKSQEKLSTFSRPSI